MFDIWDLDDKGACMMKLEYECNSGKRKRLESISKKLVTMRRFSLEINFTDLQDERNLLLSGSPVYCDIALRDC